MNFKYTVSSALVLWAFLVLIPALHVRAPFTLGLALGGIPLAIIGLAVFKRRNGWLVWLFLPAFIPVLITVPELIGPRVMGSGPFLALAALTVAHLMLCLGGMRIELGSDDDASRSLLIHTILHAFILIVLMGSIHFHQPTRELIARSYPGFEQPATTLIALAIFLTWVILVGRHLVLRLGRSLLQPNQWRVEWLRFEADSTDIDRARAALGASLLVGALCLGILVIVLLFGG
jgi:hypothetical protein